MMRAVPAVFVCLTLLVPAGLAAQEGEQPLTWLAFSRVNSGRTQDAVEMTLEYDRASYDKLVAEGTILSWGIATPINHEPGDLANHVMWVMLPGWSAIDRWTAEFQATMEGRSPEEMARIQERVEEVYETGSHYDSVRTNLHFEAPIGGPLPRYVYVSTYKVGSGMEQRLFNLFQSVVAPVGRALQAPGEGGVHGFGLQAPRLHGDPGWTHEVWYTVADLETVGRIQGSIAAAMTPALAEEYAAIADPAAHRDRIWLILHQSGALEEDSDQRSASPAD